MTSKPLPTPAALAVALLLLLAALAGISLATPSSASACPPQGCHVPPDEEPPRPGPPTPPPPKYRLTILSLHPFKTEDGFADEAYIRVKGSTVYGPRRITSLQTWQLNIVRDFTGPLWIEVYDEDSPDPDDWLGTAYPQLPALGSPYYANLQFTADGAHYVMFVHVARLS